MNRMTESQTSDNRTIDLDRLDFGVIRILDLRISAFHCIELIIIYCIIKILADRHKTENQVVGLAGVHKWNQAKA